VNWTSDADLSRGAADSTVTALDVACALDAAMANDAWW
jgi:hypothetical protein